MSSATDRHARARLTVAWVLCLLAAPVAAHGLARVLAAWLGLAYDGVAVSAAALLPVLVVGALAVALGSVRPRVAWLIGAPASAAGLIGGAPALLAALIGTAIAAAGLAYLAERAPVPRGRAAAIAWGVLAALATVQVARMSTFLGDPSQRWGALAPDDQFMVEHSCLSSYVHGAALARLGDANIYDDRYGFEVVGTKPELPCVIDTGPLSMDTYEYPPLFLPLPRLMLAITGDFLAIRALWFLLTALSFVWAALSLARWLGGDATRRAQLLALAVAMSPAALITAYTGNFQLSAIALSALGMLWIFRGRTRSGAALLAFMIGAKIFPGVLGIYLLAARRWAAAAWTAAFGALYALLALVVVGTRPFVDFVQYHLPRVASGETFGFLDQPMPVASNLGPFGLPFKLRALGWSGSTADAWALAQRIAWGFTALVVAVAVVAGLRAGAQATPRGRARTAGAWFALLALGAMRSPFAPPGLLVALAWALSLRTAAADRPGEPARLAALWVLSTVVVPAPTPIGLAFTIVSQAIIVGAALWLALGRRE